MPKHFTEILALVLSVSIQKGYLSSSTGGAVGWDGMARSIPIPCWERKFPLSTALCISPVQAEATHYTL